MSIEIIWSSSNPRAMLLQQNAMHIFHLPNWLIWEPYMEKASCTRFQLERRNANKVIGWTLHNILNMRKFQFSTYKLKQACFLSVSFILSTCSNKTVSSNTSLSVPFRLTIPTSSLIETIQKHFHNFSSSKHFIQNPFDAIGKNELGEKKRYSKRKREKMGGGGWEQPMTV